MNTTSRPQRNDLGSQLRRTARDLLQVASRVERADFADGSADWQAVFERLQTIGGLVADCRAGASRNWWLADLAADAADGPPPARVGDMVTVEEVWAEDVAVRCGIDPATVVGQQLPVVHIWPGTRPSVQVQTGRGELVTVSRWSAAA